MTNQFSKKRTKKRGNRRENLFQTTLKSPRIFQQVRGRIRHPSPHDFSKVLFTSKTENIYFRIRTGTSLLYRKEMLNPCKVLELEFRLKVFTGDRNLSTVRLTYTETPTPNQLIQRAKRFNLRFSSSQGGGVVSYFRIFRVHKGYGNQKFTSFTPSFVTSLV